MIIIAEKINGSIPSVGKAIAAKDIDFIKNLAKSNQVKFPVLSDRFNIVAKRYMIARLP